MDQSNLAIRKLATVAMIILLLASFAVYYFLYAVPKNQSELDERGFRILARVEKNIFDKKKNFQKTIDEINSKIPGNKDFLIKKMSMVDKIRVPKSGKKPTPVIYNLKDECWKIQMAGEYYYLEKKSTDSRKSVFEIGSLQSQTIRETDRLCYKSKDSLLLYQQDLGAFIAPILSYRKDFFEDFIVFKGDSIVYQSRHFAHQGNFKKDTSKIQSSKVFNATLAGKEYFVFYYPFDASKGLPLVVCGLVPVADYTFQKFHMSNFQVLVILIWLGVILTCLPYIKIFTMSRFERLQKFDVYAIITTLFTGSIGISLLFSLHVVNMGDEDWGVKNLKNINHQIKKNFYEEIKRNYNLLVNIESKFESSPGLITTWYKPNLILPFTTLTGYSEAHAIRQNFFDCTDTSCGHCEGFYFINNDGTIYTSWTRNGDLLPHISVNERNYYKEIVNQQNPGYHIQGGGKFMMQPLYSYQDQKNSVVFSKQASPTTQKIFNNLANTYQQPDKLSVIALETNLFSVMNTSLNSSMGFCIINEDGEVLFHSQKARNLMENFIEECDIKERLKSAIYNRHETALETKYFGKPHSLYMSPVEGLPLFVITYQDQTYCEDAKAEIISFTLVMAAALFGVCIIIALAYVLSTNRVRYIMKNRMNFNFLKFMKDNLIISKEVFKLLLYWLVLFILISCVAGHTLLLIFSFTIPVSAFVCCIPVIYNIKAPNFNKIPFLDVIRFRYIVLYAISIAIYVALSIIFIFILRQDLPNILLWGAVTLLQAGSFIYLSRYFYKSYIPKAHKDRSSDFTINDITMQLKYSGLTMILFIIICAVLPIVNFMRVASAEEAKIIFKRRSLQTVKNAIDRKRNYIDKYDTDYAYIYANKEDLISKGIYISSCDTLNRKKTVDKSTIAHTTSNTNALTRFYLDLAYYTKVNFNELEIQQLYLSYDKSSDSTSWFWTEDDKGRTLQYQYAVLNDLSDTFGYTFRRNFASYRFIKDDVATQFLFIALWMAVLVMLYYLINYIYRKISLIEYFYRTEYKISDQVFLDNLKEGTSNLMIISLPGSGVLEKLNQSLGNEEEFKQIPDFKTLFKTEQNKQVMSLDFKAYQFVKPKDKMEYIILLEYFDMKNQNNDVVINSIPFFENIFRSHKYKVIWVTTNDPYDQIDGIRKGLVSQYSSKLKENDPEKIEKFTKMKYDFDKLLLILDDFYKFYFGLAPIQSSETSSAEVQSKLFESNYPYTFQLINSELQYGQYLHKLKKSLFDDPYFNIFSMDTQKLVNHERYLYKKSCNLNEEIILKIQDISKNYYFSIWSCLTNEEKYVLYNIAHDGLTNYKNHAALLVLKEKGLLIYNNENALLIFNKSFRNFILSVVDPTEALLLEKEVKVVGTWEVTRSILIIILLVSGSFIFFTQQAVFQKVLGLITSMLSIIPVIFNLASGGSKK